MAEFAIRMVRSQVINFTFEVDDDDIDSKWFKPAEYAMDYDHDSFFEDDWDTISQEVTSVVQK